ncbi:MAG: hypothetical protein AB7Q17_01650 [Phycisphaerae bacterium]
MNRAHCLACVVLAAFAGRPSVALDDASVLDRLRTRAQKLDRLRATFTLAEFQAPQDRDPFDTNNWLWPPHAWRHQFSITLLRPHFNLHRQPGRDHQATQSWIDGVQASLELDSDGRWSASRSPDRRWAKGPFPHLTMFDLDYFDLEVGLADLLAKGVLTATEEGPVVVLAGNVPAWADGPSWRIRAELDPLRDLVAVRLECFLQASGGVIEWLARVSETQRVGNSYMPKTAVIALRNTQVTDKTWQMYEYRLESATIDPDLSKRDLEIAIPTTNVGFVDQIKGVSRRVDAQGRVLEERRWDPSEYQANMRSLIEANYLRQQSAAELGRRRNVFIAIIATAAIVAASLGGWAWLRRRQLAA